MENALNNPVCIRIPNNLSFIPQTVQSILPANKSSVLTKNIHNYAQ